MLEELVVKKDFVKSIINNISFKHKSFEQVGYLLFKKFYHPDSGLKQKLIFDFVAAPSSFLVNDGSHVVFKEDKDYNEYNFILKVNEFIKKFPIDDEVDIIGWYHTHPNLGVFMSSKDKNTQLSHQRSYNPSFVSLVIDPFFEGIFGFFKKSQYDFFNVDDNKNVLKLCLEIF